jgi:glutamate-ammonia-ligase adenylyltransferase
MLRSPTRSEHAAEIRAMRSRIEQSRSERDVKRGRGGQADVEFLLQLLQLKYGRKWPQLLTTNTWSVLDAAHQVGLLGTQEWLDLQAGYDFLRRVESRVRLMTNRALDEYPESPAEQEKLAQRLRLANPAEFLSTLEHHRRRVRELFEAVVRRESRD